jgi:carbon storage regulator
MVAESVALANGSDESVQEQTMLVLSRKLGEKIILNGNMIVTVVKIDRNQVRLGIEAPPEVAILREEIALASDREYTERTLAVQ